MPTEKSRLLYAVPSRTRSSRPVPKKEPMFTPHLHSQEEWEALFSYKERIALTCQWNIPNIHEGTMIYTVHEW